MSSLSHMWASYRLICNRYYIHLGAVEPRATFVHPSEELNDKEKETTPAFSSPSSQSSGSGSGSISPHSSTTPLSQPRVKVQSVPIASTITRRATAAQQLYASSFGFGSKLTKSLPSTWESVSSSNTSFNSDPDHLHSASTHPVNSSSQSYHPGHTHLTKRDFISSPTFPVSRSSHDPRHFFDLTRLSNGTRKYRHDEPSSISNKYQPVPVPTPRSSSPSYPATSGDHHSVRVDGSIRNNAIGLSEDFNSTLTITGLISPEAQAFYNPSIIPRPLPPSRSSTLARRHTYTISDPLNAGVNRTVRTKRDQKRPQPIDVNQSFSSNLKLYTAITEDESLKIAPNSNSGSYSRVSGITEDNLLVLPLHCTPTSPQRGGDSPPPINVLDLHNPDSPPQSKSVTKFPRTSSISRLNIMKKKSLHGDDKTVVLQQPRPIRPFSGVPSHLNTQDAGVDSSSDVHSRAGSIKGKSKESRMYGSSTIFG